MAVFNPETSMKRREIIHLPGAQMFFSDKNEVVLRKAPNLVMSPYDCIKQLKNIYTQIEHLKNAASFFKTVLENWEKNTQETKESLHD